MHYYLIGCKFSDYLERHSDNYNNHLFIYCGFRTAGLSQIGSGSAIRVLFIRQRLQ